MAEKELRVKTGTARLMELAMMKKPQMICSAVLSALAAVAGFMPFIAIYWIVREVLTALPDLAALNGAALIRNGWLAFAGVVANIALYFAALVCSHLAAFGTLYQ